MPPTSNGSAASSGSIPAKLLTSTVSGYTLVQSKVHQFNLAAHLEKTTTAASGGDAPPPYRIPIASWRHDKSGMHFIFFETGSALARSACIIPTGSPNDAGLPHTLEHLIFEGSKKHPQTGFLRQCSARSVAPYLPAATAREYTTYECMTAGTEGMFKFLPLFMDHVLHPKLANDDFYPEVFHVKPDGTCSGVVFSEMISRYTGQVDQVWDIRLKTLYPKNTPYGQDGNGNPEHIRCLRNSEIREFHEMYYRPEHVTCIIVGGNLDPSTLFEEIDRSGVLSVDIPPNSSPELTLPRVMVIPRWPVGQPKFISKRFEYPGTAGEKGTISYNFMGPAHDEAEDVVALNILQQAIFTSETSVVLKSVVRGGPLDPSWCSGSAGITSSYGRGCMMLNFSRVHDEYMEPGVFHERLKFCLNHISKHGFTEPIVGWETRNNPNAAKPSSANGLPSASRSSSEVDRDKADLDLIRNTISSWANEESHDVDIDLNEYLFNISRRSLIIQLYPTVESDEEAAKIPRDPFKFDLDKMRDPFAIYASLRQKPLSYWRDLFNKYYIDTPVLEIFCVPTVRAAENLDASMKAMAEQFRTGKVIEPMVADFFGEEIAAAKATGNEEIFIAKLAEIRQRCVDICARAVAAKTEPAEPSLLPPLPNFERLRPAKPLTKLVSIANILPPGSTLNNSTPFESASIVQTQSAFTRVRFGINLNGLPARLAPYLDLLTQLTYYTDIVVPDGVNAGDANDAAFVAAVRKYSTVDFQPAQDPEGLTPLGYVRIPAEPLQLLSAAEFEYTHAACVSWPFERYLIATTSLALPETIAKALRYSIHTLLSLRFDKDITLSICKRMLTRMEEYRRSRTDIASSILGRLCTGLEYDFFSATGAITPGFYTAGSLPAASSYFVQIPLYRRFVEILSGDDEEAKDAIFDKLEQIIDFIAFEAGRCYAHVMMEDDSEGVMKLPGYLQVSVPYDPEEPLSKSDSRVTAMAIESLSVWQGAVAARLQHRALGLSSIKRLAPLRSVASQEEEQRLPVLARPHPMWMPLPVWKPLSSDKTVCIVSESASITSSLSLIRIPFTIPGSRTLDGSIPLELEHLVFLTSLLAAHEFPMFLSVRGGGYAYDQSIGAHTRHGYLTLQVNHAAMPVEGIDCALKILRLLRDNVPADVKESGSSSSSGGTQAAKNEKSMGFWDKHVASSTMHIDAIRCKLMYDSSSQFATPSNVTKNELHALFRGFPNLHNWQTRESEIYSKVTAKDLRVVFDKYVAPMLDPKSPKVAICVVPMGTATPEMLKQFASIIPGTAPGSLPEVIDLDKWESKCEISDIVGDFKN